MSALPTLDAAIVGSVSMQIGGVTITGIVLMEVMKANVVVCRNFDNKFFKLLHFFGKLDT